MRHRRAAEPGIELTGGGTRGAAGKTVSIVAPDAGTLVLSRAVFWSNGYLVPKGDGTSSRVARKKNAGFDDRPTVDGIRSLLDLARRLVARLANSSLQLWHGRDCVR